MRLGFVIERKNYYRLFGPIIDRALARGFEVDCWHDLSQLRTGPKALEFPDPSAVPRFRQGRPRVQTYRGAADLASRLGSEPRDATVAVGCGPAAGSAGAGRWFGLQYTLDVAALVEPDGRSRCDGIGLHTPYWASRTVDALRIVFHNRPDVLASIDAAAIARTIDAKGTVVGFPQMDQLHDVDRALVRRRLHERFGIDPARPVVLYAPFPFRSNPRPFWVRHIYGAGSGLHQRLAVALARRGEYRDHIARGWTDRRVVDAVRRFCDANGAALVVKARTKDPVPGYLARHAEAVLYDESYYPTTVLELMSIASLVIHCFSTISYEAAYAAVPSICIAALQDDLGFPVSWQEWFHSVKPGDTFNVPGVVYPLTLDAVLHQLPSARLSDFPLELPARARYIEKFVGFDDGKCSDRVLDAIQSLVEGRRR
jgi:hypothetical protein